VSTSGSELCFADEVLNGLVEEGVSGAEWWRCIGDDLEVESLETGSQDARLDFCEKQSHAAAVRCERVAQLAGHLTDKCLAFETAKVVPHLARGIVGVVHSKQLGNQWAEALVGDSLRREREQTQCRQQSSDARVAEPERGCWLAVWCPSRGGESSEVGVAEAAVMRSTLQVQDSRVDTLSEGAEVGEVKVVSVRRARLSLKYCLMWQRLYSTCKLGWIPSVTMRVENSPGVLART
jgi:hypothetical protein